MKEKIRADLKRFIVKQTVAKAADHAGDSGGLKLRGVERPEGARRRSR